METSAIFINSSQDSGERGKAGSKRSGPHDDAIAEGSMAEEEDRSGKAAAGRSPDEFMKVAETSTTDRRVIPEALTQLRAKLNQKAKQEPKFRFYTGLWPFIGAKRLWIFGLQ